MNNVGQMQIRNDFCPLIDTMIYQSIFSYIILMKDTRFLHVLYAFMKRLANVYVKLSKRYSLDLSLKGTKIYITNIAT